ncbi:unnamed protein product [Rotaria sp. Silwood2]|nr:unnamed protein product [Rotaria sp. Silwood2]CAF4226314.1 unnamed protein product [Rotaria sp. Silwood2]
MLPSDAVASANEQPPIMPLSDVTSSLMPTSIGESCILPYNFSTYTWDMYFCNNGYCPTPSNQNTECRPGKYGYFGFISSKLISLPLKTGSGSINGINQQCLTYYYFFSNMNGTQHIINVRKEEVGSTREIIDNVKSSPFNGWIKHEVNFTTATSGYKIYFNLEKKTTSVGVRSYIALDEISIYQGNCFDKPSTESTDTTLITSMETTTADTVILTSVSDTSIEQITSITTTEPLTTVISNP